MNIEEQVLYISLIFHVSNLVYCVKVILYYTIQHFIFYFIVVEPAKGIIRLYNV